MSARFTYNRIMSAKFTTRQILIGAVQGLIMAPTAYHTAGAFRGLTTHSSTGAAVGAGTLFQGLGQQLGPYN